MFVSIEVHHVGTMIYACSSWLTKNFRLPIAEGIVAFQCLLHQMVLSAECMQQAYGQLPNNLWRSIDN